MDKEAYTMGPIDVAWCPGCGNFPILNFVKQALAELDIPPERLVMVSGIGQAAKSPHYLKCNFFNGLHGRAVPPATAIKAANQELVVIVESGDGDMYGEGGNHFIHAIRRNPNITVLVHNNMVYGLTKGQASPTSQKGYKTPVQVNGVYMEPFNPMAVAVALRASFVARANAGDPKQAKEIIKAAIQHKGFSLVDIFQSCIVFNKVNTYQWFKDNTYTLPLGYDPTDRDEAFKKAMETDKFPLGILYLNSNSPTFEENLGLKPEEPFYKKQVAMEKIQKLLESFK